MKERKKTLFKVNNETVLEKSNDLFLNQIDELKWIIADTFSCSYDDVEVEMNYLPIDTSDIDVTSDGLIDWKDTTGKLLTGINFSLVYGSDEHLDAILDGTIENFLTIN